MPNLIQRVIVLAALCASSAVFAEGPEAKPAAAAVKQDEHKDKGTLGGHGATAAPKVTSTKAKPAATTVGQDEHKDKGTLGGHGAKNAPKATDKVVEPKAPSAVTAAGK